MGLVVQERNMPKYKRPTDLEILETVAVLESVLKTKKKLEGRAAYRNQLLALKWVLGLEKKFVHYNKEDLYD